MIKNKKTWYIWFSLLAFMFLWGDTSRRIKYTKRGRKEGGYELWSKACNNFFRMGCFYFFLPIIITSIFANIILWIFSNNQMVGEILSFFIFIIIYLSGIVITDKHKQWRDENIFHLINKQPSVGEDESDLK